MINNLQVFNKHISKQNIAIVKLYFGKQIFNYVHLATLAE